jgi:hypothetical protein
MTQLFQYNRVTGFLFFALALLSCKKDFLEINPKGKLIATKTLEYDALLYGTPLVTSMQILTPMGDELAAIQPYFSTAMLVPHTRLFRWEDDIYEPGVAAPEFTQLTAGLYTYNKVINEVLASTGGTEQQKKALHGEALAFRAWTYFSLINLYGKPYNASSAATDLGFPIITKADATETNFTRASVKEVYDFIVADLTEAIPNLPAKTTHRHRMSKPAAEGLLAKVYVFMGKYNEALVQLNASVSGMSSSSIPVGLYDYNETFAPTTGSFLPVGVNGPAQPPPLDDKESFVARLSDNRWSRGFNELIINPKTVALYDSSDLRRKFYSNAPRNSTTPYPLGMLRRTGPANYKIGVVVPDLYLLRAECKARLNDLAGAKADVETLRKNRMPAAHASVPAAIGSDRKALVKFILEERIREFAVLGNRWFDMRRLSVDAEFGATVGTTHTLYSASGTVESTFTLRPERLVLRLPLLVIEKNPGMQNNP